jgi:hypothetical protein
MKFLLFKKYLLLLFFKSKIQFQSKTLECHKILSLIQNYINCFQRTQFNTKTNKYLINWIELW